MKKDALSQKVFTQVIVCWFISHTGDNVVISRKQAQKLTVQEAKRAINHK